MTRKWSAEINPLLTVGQSKAKASEYSASARTSVREQAFTRRSAGCPSNPGRVMYIMADGLDTKTRVVAKMLSAPFEMRI